MNIVRYIFNELILINKNIAMAFRSLFWKKDDGVVIVGAWFGERFADNSRFLFQYLCENKKKLGLKHVVWVSHSESLIKELKQMGYEAVKLGSRESIYYHKIARFHICNNSAAGSTERGNEIDAYYSFRAKRINLWHGIGIKGGEFCSNRYLDRKKRHPIICSLYEKMHNIELFRLYCKYPGGWGNCYWLSTTPAFTEYLHKWNIGPYSHYMELDYPRNHKCLKLTQEESEVVALIKQHKKTAIYLPTFRDDKIKFDFSFLADSISLSLEANDILWIQKTHSVDKSDSLQHSQNIITLDSKFDINVLLPYISVVITDYSSVSIDAIYHEKPVVYYVPDWDYYINSDRGFVERIEDYFAGPIARTENDVLKNILSPPVLDEHYYYVRNRYWRHDMTYSDIWKGIKESTS